MQHLRRSRGIPVRGVALIGMIVLCAALTGCTAGRASNGSPSAPATPAVAAEATASGTAAQLCAECGGMGAPAVVRGQTVAQNGSQVLQVAVVDGYYSPNTFTVKAGVPVVVTFSGSAKGCVAKPNFAELDKRTDITGTGIGTIELGALDAGTYHFACGMGANQGTITVE